MRLTQKVQGLFIAIVDSEEFRLPAGGDSIDDRKRKQQSLLLFSCSLGVYDLCGYMENIIVIS